MTAPQDDAELVHKLAAMTDSEFHAVVSKARGITKEHAADVLASYVRQDYFTVKGE